MSRTSDVAVIGAGVFGAWTALQLRRSGQSVTLVDAFGAGNTRSSSGGASRVLRIGYGRETIYSEWAQRSRAAWQELFRDGRHELFTQTGVLWMARPDDASADATIETLRRLRVPCEILGRPELEQRYPQFNFGPITRGVLEPEAGVVMARRWPDDGLAIAASDEKEALAAGRGTVVACHELTPLHVVATLFNGSDELAEGLATARLDWTVVFVQRAPVAVMDDLAVSNKAVVVFHCQVHYLHFLWRILAVPNATPNMPFCAKAFLPFNVTLPGHCVGNPAVH